MIGQRPRASLSHCLSGSGLRAAGRPYSIHADSAFMLLPSFKPALDRSAALTKALTCMQSYSAMCESFATSCCQCSSSCARLPMIDHHLGQNPSIAHVSCDSFACNMQSSSCCAGAQPACGLLANCESFASPTCERFARRPGAGAGWPPNSARRYRLPSKQISGASKNLRP